MNSSALVPYTVEQMFRLVDDIESYPDFVPWCSEAEVHERNAAQVRASLQMHAAGMMRRFTTLNRLDPHRAIEIELLDGPFSHLSGGWRFEPRNRRGSRVSLQMRFRFASSLAAFALGPGFEHTCNSLVDVFTRRARVVYGGS